MPIDKEKSSSYLRYLKSLNEVTYAKITELTGVPNTTISTYLNGSVKTPNRDTFEKLMIACGGGWDEYDNWTPDVQADLKMPPKSDTSIEQIQKAFESSAMRMEAAFNASLARMESAHDKEIARMEHQHAATVWALRLEKYLLLAVICVIGFYAIFQFSH
jgi:transcriptional regulator with XRE-family HTH domain